LSKKILDLLMLHNQLSCHYEHVSVNRWLKPKFYSVMFFFHNVHVKRQWCVR